MAGHVRVGAAFECLVEDGGAAGDGGDAGEGIEGVEMEGAEAGAEVAKVKAGGGGDDDHGGDAGLEEDCVGGEEGRVCGGRGAGELGGEGGRGHVG